MNWWLIYTEADNPYLWSFDASVLPPGQLYNRLKESPLMFRAFTTEQNARQFIDYVSLSEGTLCISRCFTKQGMSAEFVRLRSQMDSPIEWVCIDEQPWSNRGVGTPVNIEEFVSGA